MAGEKFKIYLSQKTKNALIYPRCLEKNYVHIMNEIINSPKL